MAPPAYLILLNIKHEYIESRILSRELICNLQIYVSKRRKIYRNRSNKLLILVEVEEIRRQPGIMWAEYRQFLVACRWPGSPALPCNGRTNQVLNNVLLSGNQPGIFTTNRIKRCNRVILFSTKTNFIDNKKHHTIL